jgi:hypothetical protein
MSTEHSLQARQVDDVDADMERFAIDYVTPSQHTFGLEYRHARAEFPNFIATEFDTRGPQYEENAALAHISYNATVHTRLGATFGYVDRTRPDGFEGGYSGDTWRAEIDWHPRQKFSTLLSAWHEIKAYSDAESDYFIADGVSIAPEWKPLQTISISIAVSYEEQDYIGSNLLLDQTSARADDVLGAQTTFVYSPRPNLELQLQYQYFDRDSNRDWRRYDAQVAGASIRWRVM